MNELNILKDIMNDVEEYLLKCDSPYIIMSGYEYFREVITLFAKQHNLIESTILLLENNHNEEAMILARSIMNNYFLIGYLLDDPNKQHIKIYQIQPYINELYYYKNLKKILRSDFKTDIEKRGKSFSYTEADIDNKISSLKRCLKDAGFKPDIQPLKIAKLARLADKRGFELYTAFYTTASKFEHSDFSTLNIYKEQITDENSNNEVFCLSSSKTDENLKEQIMSIIIISYAESCIKIIDEITENQPHLKTSYDENKLGQIMIKIMQLI